MFDNIPRSGSAEHKILITVIHVKGKSNLWGNIIVFETSKSLRGEGDASMGFCAPGCGKLIAHMDMGKYTTVCPSCGKIFETGVPDCMMFGSDGKPAKSIAEEVEKIWYNLGGKADITLTRYKGSLQKAMEDGPGAETKKKLEITRRSREEVIYSLDRLLTDVQGGRSIKSCIKSLLRA